MNTAIATRLLWKEYRQQRNLWLALLFGATLLQLIFWLFIEEPKKGMWDHSLLPLHVGTAAMMTGMFAVCSAAISFAIEREEGTHLRLVSLSCPPGLALGIKFAVGLLGVVLLFAVSTVIGVSLSTGFGGFAEAIRQVSRDEWFASVYWSVVAVCGGLVIGSCCSLLFRKVLPAVICACVLSFVGFPILLGIWSEAAVRYDRHFRLDNPEAIWFMVFLIVAIGVLGLVDFVLVGWWMNRGFSEMPKVRERSLFRRVRVQRDGLDGSVTLEIGGADRAAFEVLTADQARILPAPRFGLSLLYNNWGRGRSRVLRFLCWKEAAESRRIFQVLLVAGIVLALFATGSLRAARVLDSVYQVRPGNELPFLMMYSFLCVFVCGLMSFRGEQSGDSYRLLSDHGLNPGYVWASKQMVWLTRLLMIVLAVLTIVAVGVGVLPLRYFLWMLSGNQSATLQESAWLPSLIALLFAGLIYFSICQMASLTWRRAALSIFFALLCCILMGMWHGAAANFDVPVVVAALPMVPALLLMTRLRTRSWLIGDDRLKCWLLPGAAGVLGIAACWLTTATWRIYEIPSAEPLVATKTLDDGSTVETINGLTDAEREAILAPVSDEEATTADLYRRAAETFSLGGSSQVSQHTRELIFGIPQPDPPPPVRDDPEMMKIITEGNRLTLEHSTEAFELCRQAAVREVCASESPVTGIAGENAPFYKNVYVNRMPGLANLMLVYAERELRAGNPSEALAIHHDAFAMARHAAGRGVDREFNQWRVITLAALNSLADWSKSADVTSELVSEAAEIVNDHLAKSPDPYAVSFARHQVLRNTLQLPVEQLLAMQRGRSHSNDEFFFAFMSVKFPGTRERAGRLVDWYEARSARLIAEAQKRETQGGSGGSTLGNWYRQEVGKSSADLGGLPVADFRRWVQTTPLARGLIDDIGLSLVYSETDLKTQARGTQIVMQLWLALRENGEFPQTLEELNLPARVVIEPWSGRPFAWYPNGIPNEIKTTDPPIPAHTPFLFSGGPWGAYLQEQEVMVRVEGPFDPPPQVIPLDRGAVQGETRSDKESRTPPPGKVQAFPPAAGVIEFFGPGGGMGASGAAATDSNVRWEARREFVIHEAESNAGPLKSRPTVWLFPAEADKSEQVDDTRK